MTFLLLVTIISMLLALVMSVIAWRVGREERRRVDARVAALSAEIHGNSRAVRFTPRTVDDIEIRPAVAANVSMPAIGMFSSQTTPPPASRMFAVIGIGVLVFGSAVALAVMLSGGSAARPVPVAATSAISPESTSALELVALVHERDGDNLTVRGVVRSPSGQAIDRLTAVVFLFSRDGGFLASGRTAVESRANGRGVEGTFVVTVPDASDVGRYRVSFRTDDKVVPHVDRRDHLNAQDPGSN